MAGLLAKILSPLLTKGEGQFRPGPYMINYGGREGNGWLPAGSPINYWQTGLSPRPFGENNAMVEACVSARTRKLLRNALAIIGGRSTTVAVNGSPIPTSAASCVNPMITRAFLISCLT